jgi:hypothetical protein
MDPYLEHPALWPDVHNSLIAEMRRDLAPRVRPTYYVGIEERTYVAPSGSASRALTVELPMPDRLRETFLEVRAVESGEVVTVVELLSPSNKVDGEGRRLYERKRRSILASLTHLVEIDLVRSGRSMPVRGDDPTAMYRILISREDARPQAALLPFSLRDPIPRFVLPLQPGDPEPELDVGRILGDVYEQAGYDLVIDYAREPAPPLADDDRMWADALLREAGKRAAT